MFIAESRGTVYPFAPTNKLAAPPASKHKEIGFRCGSEMRVGSCDFVDRFFS